MVKEFGRKSNILIRILKTINDKCFGEKCEKMEGNVRHTTKQVYKLSLENTKSKL